MYACVHDGNPRHKRHNAIAIAAQNYVRCTCISHKEILRAFEKGGKKSLNLRLNVDSKMQCNAKSYSIYLVIYSIDLMRSSSSSCMMLMLMLMLMFMLMRSLLPMSLFH